MDHVELVRELPQIERMTNQERLKLAHSRRKQQLKLWSQREKAVMGKGSKQHLQDVRNSSKTRTGTRVNFTNSIMLLEAAGRNDIGEVRRLLANGVSSDVANDDGLTSLHQCCIDDNEEMMRLLFDFGANVNAEDSEKWTPLHASAACGHLQICKQLVERGANLLAVNNEGNMPYDLADSESTLDYIENEMAQRGVTQELIEEIRALPETEMLQDMKRIRDEGGDLEYRDQRDGATYLHIAAANGHVKVVEFLLDNHVAIDVHDNDFWQPLHAAAAWNNLEIIELLVQNGADLNSRTKNNETPYAICEDAEIKERILQMRTEQETLRNAAVKKIRRSHSSNSRTQSIRRTSQRDRGLTSKRDVAVEAQTRLVVSAIDIKDESPSPSPTSSSTFMDNGHGPDNIAVVAPLNHDTESQSSADEVDGDLMLKSMSPVLMMGRDSITQLHSAEVWLTNKRDSKRQKRSPSKIADNAENNSELNPLNNNGGMNDFNSMVLSVPTRNSFDDKTNLTTPEVNPTIELQPKIGTKGGNSLDNLNGGNNTIDIRVQVTINTNPTNSSPAPIAFSGLGLHGSQLISNSTHALYSPPGTLSDLKKQRSLQYAGVGRSNNVSHFQHSELDVDSPPKYEIPGSPSLSLKRFTGDPAEIVGDYSEERKKCCIIV